MAEPVSTEWLAARLGDDGLVVLDASQHMPGSGRDAAAEFAAGHIPGARYLDLASFVDDTSAVPRALPRADQVAERLAALGVSDGQTLVLYDDSTIRTAARAWFVLRHYGIEAVILDGGLGKWRSEGRAIEAGMPSVEPGRVTVAESREDVRDKDDMLANIAAQGEQVVDARDGERFAGTATTDPHGQEGGHIPGARSLPFGELYNPDGTLKPEAELRAAFERAGVALDQPIVASCGSGVTACTLLFALDRLGRGDAALYDGSWLEWGADPATPKEQGPAA